MLFSNIKVGDRLEIAQLREHKLEKTYVSQVEHVLLEDEIVVHVPISYGQIVKLSLKERYSLLFFTERGMIRFDAEIMGYSKEQDLHFMTVKLLSEGERIQRREFFRFNCLLPIKFAVIHDDE
ncbi:MAG: flagellar brake protein, partial [Clostridiales bacterium]|nr:flagellar brake protein [Clostridiales bacterium]